MSGTKCPGIQHGGRAPNVPASAEKNTLYSVLLTVSPASWRVENLTEGGIYLVEFYKRNRINFDCIEAII